MKRRNHAMKGIAKGVVFLLVVLVWVGHVHAEVIRGKVSMVDLEDNRIEVNSQGENRNFSFDPQDFIVWKGDDEVKTDQIKEGSDAEIGYYTDERGVEVASWVDLTPLEESISVPGEDLLP